MIYCLDIPWFLQICENFDVLCEPLLTAEQTVIHGEFYPLNILVQRGQIFPVDWESTAIACGEIDLASLTERWPEDISNSCIDSYINARWPAGAPDNFEQVLDSARMYLNLRWLGDRKEWTESEGYAWRFELMHEIGQRLSLF